MNRPISPLGWSPKEAAKILGIGNNLIYKLIHEGKIQAIRVGERRLIIPQSAIDRLFEQPN